MSKPVVPLMTWGKPEPYSEMEVSGESGNGPKSPWVSILKWAIVTWINLQAAPGEQQFTVPRNWMLFTEEMRMVVSWRTLPPNHDRTMPCMGTAGPCFIHEKWIEHERTCHDKNE